MCFFFFTVKDEDCTVSSESAYFIRLSKGPSAAWGERKMHLEMTVSGAPLMTEQVAHSDRQARLTGWIERGLDGLMDGWMER